MVSSRGNVAEFEWQINWKLCLLCALLLLLLVSLGFWQLHRAQEKQTLQELLKQQQELPALQWSRDSAKTLVAENVAFRQVVMTGSFDPQKIWLLENQTWQGQLGVHVIQLFSLQDGGAVLVNRGWLAAGEYRNQLPPVPATSAKRVRGRLVKPTDNIFLKQQPLIETWPQTLLEVNIDQLQAVSKGPLIPWILQIDEADPSALQVHWRNINMPASKHLGYAWQWFSMAFVLSILTLFANSNLSQVLVRNNKKSPL